MIEISCVSKTVRNADERELADYHPEFSDDRLGPLLLHYKARNYPKSLSADESSTWELWRGERIMKKLPSYIDKLQKLAGTRTGDNEQFILQELQLWAESIVPTDLSGQDSES